MTLSRVVIRNPVETPAQLIKQYVDWLKSHPSGAGANEPASVGFMMAVDVPLEFGLDVAVSSRGLQPEIIYSQGNLSISGGTSLVGHGFARSSSDGFGKSVSISVRLDPSGTLKIDLRRAGGILRCRAAFENASRAVQQLLLPGVDLGSGEPRMRSPARRQSARL